MKVLFVNILPLILTISALGQRTDSRLTVTVFLGIDCPISQDYILTLNNIYEQYKDFVNMEGVFPGKCKRKLVERFRAEYGLKFPTKRDCKNRMANALNAKVTPEAFLVDQSRTVIYRGAIDDWYFELGRHRSLPTENFLIDAIKSSIEGTEVTVKETNAIGCFIEKAK